MTRIITASLLSAGLVGTGIMSATAAPISPAPATPENRSQVEKVQETRYYRRTYVYRRVHRPAVEVYESPAYSYRVYRYDDDDGPYSYDHDDNDGPYTTVDRPFFGLNIDGPRRYYRRNHDRHHLYVDW